MCVCVWDDGWARPRGGAINYFFSCAFVCETAIFIFDSTTLLSLPHAAGRRTTQKRSYVDLPSALETIIIISLKKNYLSISLSRES